MSKDTVTINRAPVLTLWAAVVAEATGHDRETALTLGKAVAGLNAQAKGRAIGIFKPQKGPHGEAPKKAGLGEEFWLEVCGRAVPAKNTPDGVRAVVKDKPIEPGKVQAYLEKAFGEDLPRVRQTMENLAAGLSPEALEEKAYDLYTRFRPRIEKGKRGWGQKGELDLDYIRSMKHGD